MLRCNHVWQLLASVCLLGVAVPRVMVIVSYSRRSHMKNGTNDNGWILSGFADEIDPDPVVQLAVLQALGAAHVEVRAAWDTNVLDLTDDQLTRLSGLI